MLLAYQQHFDGVTKALVFSGIHKNGAQDGLEAEKPRVAEIIRMRNQPQVFGTA